MVPTARVFRLRPELLILLVLLLGPTAAASGRQSQTRNDDADAARLVEVLELQAGAVVADVGAGPGELSRRMARLVGPTGVVYSTEVNRGRLSDLRTVARDLPEQNMRVLEGGANRTNLPEQCCDAVFMRHVYHHVAAPAEMNASLLASLKPGGRIAVADFAPRSGSTAEPGARASGRSHGVSAVVVMDELRRAGFTEVSEMPWPSSGYFLVVGRRAP